ncbi:hypothetical protein CR513_12210, partial [Mucuna pruriens]
MKEEVWFLDFGCSNHMIENKEWFSKLDENFSQPIKLGNNTRMESFKKKAWLLIRHGKCKLRLEQPIQNLNE